MEQAGSRSLRTFLCDLDQSPARSGLRSQQEQAARSQARRSLQEGRRQNHGGPVVPAEQGQRLGTREDTRRLNLWPRAPCNDCADGNPSSLYPTVIPESHASVATYPTPHSQVQSRSRRHPGPRGPWEPPPRDSPEKGALKAPPTISPQLRHLVVRGWGTSCYPGAPRNIYHHPERRRQGQGSVRT